MDHYKNKINPLALLIFLTFLMTCTTEEQPIVIRDQTPGSITGIVKPVGTIASVYLYQGIPIDTTYSDSVTGIFHLTDVIPGFYSLRVDVDEYGLHKIDNIEVIENGVTSVGEIFLRQIPHQILNIVPWNNSKNIALDDNCEFEFSTIMDHTSVEENFQIIPEIDGYFRWSYEDNRSLMIFEPAKKYSTNTEYTLSLGTGARTELGDTLKFTVRSSFHTIPLRIESHLPENGASDVSPNSTIYIKFNTEMNKNSASIIFSPAMEGVIKWQNNESFIFTPTSYFSTNTLYTVSINRNNKDVDGHTLENDYSFVFSTEPLSIINSFPSDGATNVSRNSGIHINFNTHVDQTSAEKAFIISPNVKGIFTWSDYSKFTFNPVDKLASDAIYTITVNTTCKDRYGMNLPNSFMFAFRTSTD